MHISISKVNFTSIGINIAKVDFGRYDSGGSVEYYGMYITPADASAINVTPNDSYYTLHGKYLKYSMDGKKWKDWNGSVTIEPEQKMYLKGEDDYVWNSSTSGKLITSDGYYNLGGDISSLTNFITEVKEYTFIKLFYEDSYIKDASSLILPANTLASYCYQYMFSWCTSLTNAPALTATTLASYCYQYMFSSCKSLTTAPELPATTLTDWCYSDMFSNCTSLTSAPALHATTLANRCYYRMFYDCKSLTIATELPATTLTDWCYSNMFSGCYSLTAAPELPATTLAHSCYREMFYGCKSLTIAPELPVTTLAPYCYYGMFARCSSLITAPELPATTLTSNCYNGMFADCTSLTTAPELPAATLTFECYKQMFSGCSKLNNITMLATDISAVSCLSNWVNGVASTGTFTKAASMTSLPTGTSGIPEGWTVADYTDYMTLSALGDGEITITIRAELNSSYATSLSYSKDKSTWNETVIDDTAQTISIPVTSGENVYLKGIAKQLSVSYNGGVNIKSSADINASGNIMSLLYGDKYNGKTSFPDRSSYTFYYLFRKNTHLINADELILPATKLALSCYSEMFEECTSLTTAPELHATKLAQNCYSRMFNGCKSLTTAPELPATTLTDYCYSGMFYECTSLTTAPELPATKLTYSCYSDMFYGCSKLNSITMLATDISEWYCLRDWVYGVSKTGTFTKAVEMTKLQTGTSGIPEGWTVVEYGAVDYSQEYMTISALGDGEITITIPDIIDSSLATSLSYSKDKSNWTDTIIDGTAKTITIPVTSGDNVYLKGIAKQLGNSSTNVNINSTANINASGNIMSLLYGDDYKDKVALPSGSKYIFNSLFKNNAHLINADELILPATKLVNYCYSYMFYGCTSLTTAPELPATKLANWCYIYMFYGCTSLTTAPELPATTLSTECYSSMFRGCSSLTSAPELPATTLTTACYNGMFQGCTALTTAPALPATTLYKICYSSMFYGCTALTTAPELPATTLTYSCYDNMFAGCSKLNNITMLATDISASYCLSNWVEGVSSTGTFTKSPEMTSLPTGTSGIPEGWTVVDYVAA